MKILMGVDDSPHANAAVEFVKTHWPKETQIVVLSSVAPLLGAYTEMYVPAPAYVEGMDEELVKSHEEIAAKAERVLRGAGFRTEAKVLHGDPRNMLVELAHTERADLIVVGSHGRTGIEKLLMGSVASHVVTHAPCSVLVVKLPKTA
jgi:nucleotide-binding universal stress UspA family protein